jgi:hypothetical protein
MKAGRVYQNWADEAMDVAPLTIKDRAAGDVDSKLYSNVLDPIQHRLPRIFVAGDLKS